MHVRYSFSALGQIRTYASIPAWIRSSRVSWRQLFGRVAASLLLSQLAVTTGCGTLGGQVGTNAPLPHSLAHPSQALPAANPTAPTRAPSPSSVMHPAAAAAVVAASYEGEINPPHQYLDQSGRACSSPSQTCGPAHASGQCGCYTTATHDNYRNAQEYIFDGGDQPPAAVVRKDWSTVGINPTDTVIHYETLGGTVCMQPTNRVAIYAPRFGAVRQVAGLQLSVRAVGTERILAPLAAERFEEKNLAGIVVLPVAPHGEEQIGLIDAFQENYVGTPLDQVQPLSRMSAARVPFELIDSRRTGLITRQELVDIRQLIQNAQTWVIPESLTVEISNQPALVVKDTQAPEDLVLYETPDKCAMRICKAASHTIANSGDIISFAIRFDNAGVKPLGNVVITDSLAPRLNYIQGSQQCSVGVRFSVEPNDVGAMILRWEIEDPIQPGDGGVVTFDCQVR